MGDGPQVQVEAVTNAGDRSTLVRRHLADSVYLWACGEKAQDGDDDPKLSDRLIGWLILLVQGFAYAMLLALAESKPESNTDSSADGSMESPYLLPSVTGAMYLLVASTSNDLRAGFSLLVDGACVGHRAFGVGLLAVYGSMISTAMKIMVATSDDNASVVLNAVTVIFIADLDENALKFLLTIPQKWRLFWAIYSVGISFVLALVAVVYIVDSPLQLQSTRSSLEDYPTWLLWVVNPVAVTICSYCLSVCLQNVSDAFSEAFENVEQLTFRSTISNVFSGIPATAKRVMASIGEEPCFYATLAVWLVQGVGSWWYVVFGLPVAVDALLNVFTGGEYTSEFRESKVTFIFANTLLAIGLSVKVLSVLLSRHFGGVPTFSDPRSSSDTNWAREICHRFADSRASSLLVGWGIGYWVTSVLFVLSMAWDNYGWQAAPTAVVGVTYIVLPCFFTLCIFIVADTDFLGSTIEEVIKPAVEVIRNRRRVVYWIMVTVLRDALSLWTVICILLSQCEKCALLP